MKRYNNYKAIQELRKKDPKAYRAKLAEIRASVRCWHLSCLLHLSFDEGVDLYFEIL
jgi:hypothetical protein